MCKKNENAPLELEYDKILSYIIHLYDTRHKIFQFCVSINTILLAVIFQYIDELAAKFFLSIFAGAITISLSLMGIRSWRYLCTLEQCVGNVEEKLGLSALKIASSKMPRGMDSTKYLFFVYLLMSILWIVLSVGYLANILDYQIPMP
ncbi:MAG: hypothetical protein JKY85_02660 [Porticoccus sp.]|nr:hypothetical protein [Porticoccus sp.]